MKTAKKSLISIFVAMFLLMSTGFCLTVALADDVQPTAPVIEVTLEKKASVRMDEPYGIKFKAQANAEELTTYYGQDNVIFGMLICPADFVTEAKPLKIGVDGGLTEYNPADGGTAGADTYVNRTATPDEKGEYYCNLIDIKESNLSRPYMAVAYVGIVDGEDVTYTYSETFSRSIYTVAAYTLAGDSLLESTDPNKLGSDATTYLTNVVNKVQETYDELVVTASKTTFDGDNAFTVKSATVSNGTRTLETCVVLSSDNITRTDLTAYNATKVGEFSVTASVGDLSKTITGFNCKTVNIAIKDAFKEYAYAGAGKAILTDVTEGELKGATHWTKEGTSGSGNIGFADIVKSQAKNGNYISFDYYVDYNETDNNGSQQWPQDGRLLYVEYMVDTVSKPKYLYNSYNETYKDGETPVITYRLLDEYGVLYKKNLGGVYNTWVRIELQCHKDFSSSEVARLILVVLRSFDDGVYFKDFKVSTEPTKEVAKVTNIFNKQSDLSNIVAKDATNTDISYVSEFNGMQNVLKVEPKKDAETGDYVSSNCNFCFANNFDTVVPSTYLYFDFYNPFEGAYNGMEFFQICVSASNLYMIYQNNNLSNDNWTIYIDDEVASSTANPPHSDGKNGEFVNKWITIEVKLDAGFNSSSSWRYIGSYGAAAGPGYFANIRVSTLPLEFSRFNDANA